MALLKHLQSSLTSLQIRYIINNVCSTHNYENIFLQLPVDKKSLVARKNPEEPGKIWTVLGSGFSWCTEYNHLLVKTMSNWRSRGLISSMRMAPITPQAEEESWWNRRTWSPLPIKDFQCSSFISFSRASRLASWPDGQWVVTITVFCRPKGPHKAESISRWCLSAPAKRLADISCKYRTPPTIAPCSCLGG